MNTLQDIDKVTEALPRQAIEGYLYQDDEADHG
jgi:hypothetical protein